MAEVPISGAGQAEPGEALEAARARIEELERQLAERTTDGEHLRRLISMGPIVIYTCRPSGDYGATYISDNVTRWFGYVPEDFTRDSRFWMDRIHPDDVERTLRDLEQLFVHGHHSHEYRFQHKDGSYRWVHDELLLSRDEAGNIVELVGFWADVTDRRRAEEVIQRQADALRDMSTPLVPISDRVVAMPLIGVMDSQRARQVLSTLLEGIARTGAQVAIIDITGVGIVDTQVANTLVQSARAVQLMGAQVVLTGIRPEVAQTLVALQADLGGIVTRGTLQAGIACASGLLTR